MAETLVSPGVLAREQDQSFIQGQPVSVGAAIIGPAVKGPVEIPTVVTSYSDYQNRFGTTFVSGGDVYSYLTSISAYNYFQNGGQSLLVARVVSQSSAWDYASSTVESQTSVGIAPATGSFDLAAAFSDGEEVRITYGSSVYRFVASGDPIPQDDVDGNLYFFSTGSTPTGSATNLSAEINAAISGAAASSSVDLLFASSTDATLTISASADGTAYNGITIATGSGADFSTQLTLAGGTDSSTASTCFTLETLNKGTIMNSSSSLDASGSLESGSVDNVRWEVVNPNTSSGTFTLLVRRGDDNTNTKNVLETWTNLSLDPKANNYVAKVIGDQTLNYNSTENYVAVSGSYPNVSRYVRISSVSLTTPDYFDNTGAPKPQYTSSIPSAGSGSFSGGTGTDIASGAKYYNEITTNTQGLVAASYTNMISLLANQDEYKFNVISTPGLIDGTHTSAITSLVSNIQSRGDSIYVVDSAVYGSTVASVSTQAQTRDTSYAATYWPWVQVQDPDSGKNVWVPASTVIPGVYAFNDNASAPWFAPAGVNRGGLGQVIQAERKLSQSNRDTLYDAKVNPIASFPGTGVVVYGQKTLQTKSSALDRVNVRRLLINLKSYISQVSQNLVFEQNSRATRAQFLNAVNPYLESVQSRQGLYAFRVIMDDSNNTADVIDRNELIGQIFVQPTKTAEFIYLDFIVQPTGATFPA
jgi:hypothetical protein